MFKTLTTNETLDLGHQFEQTQEGTKPFDTLNYFRDGCERRWFCLSIFLTTKQKMWWTQRETQKVKVREIGENEKKRKEKWE